MPNIQGQKVASWDSNFGKADIKVKDKIGSQFKSEMDAHKAIVKQGEQGVIVKEKNDTYSAYSVNDGARLDDLDSGEKYTLNTKGKAAGVVDFIGDDGASLNTGTIVKAPKASKDNKKSVYFTYTLNPNEGIKGKYDKAVIGMLNGGLQKDEISSLQNKGYTVVIDKTATKADIQNALYDQSTAGWVNVGHGAEGAISTYEDDFLFPQFSFDIDPKKVSPHMKMAYLQSCQTGMEQESWQKALGPQTKIHNWDRNALNLELLLANGGSDLSFKSLITKPGLSTVLNPFSWSGQTLQQAINKNLK